MQLIIRGSDSTAKVTGIHFKIYLPNKTRKCSIMQPMGNNSRVCLEDDVSNIIIILCVYVSLLPTALYELTEWVSDCLYEYH